MLKDGKLLISIGLIASTLGMGSASASPHHQNYVSQKLLNKVVEAMGGEQRLSQIASQQIVVTGQRVEPEQTYKPGDEPKFMGTAEYVMTRKFDTEQFHTEWYIDGQYPFIEKRYYTEIINMPHAAVIGVDSLLNIPMAPMRSNRLAARIKHYDLSSPLALIKRAITNKDAVKVVTRKKHGHKNENLVLVLPGRENVVKLIIDSQTFLPKKAVTMESDSIYGDTRVSFDFSMWSAVDGVQVPHHIEMNINDTQIGEEHRDAIYLNLAIDDSIFNIDPTLQTPIDDKLFAWGLRSAQWFNRYVPSGVPFDLDQSSPPSLQIAEIAPKVFHLQGFTHNSLIIEMKDYLVLVDPALYEERTQAALPVIKAKWPTKEIRYVVPSHFHMDHIGGVRGYVADGADLIVGNGTGEHYENILESRHKIYPDAYSENPRDVAIHELDDDEESSISDGMRNVQLVHIANRHAVGMLAPYIEDAKMLFVSDLYNPGLFPGEIQPNFSFWARDLYDDLQTKNLDIQWLVGAHGGVVSYDVFEQQVLMSTP